MAMTFLCLSDDDGLKHIDSLLKSKYTAKEMGTLGFEDSDVKTQSGADISETRTC